MKKLKKQKLNAIYIAILTTVVCAILWTSAGWKDIISIAIIPFIITVSLFDERYERLFE